MRVISAQRAAARTQQHRDPSKKQQKTMHRNKRLFKVKILILKLPSVEILLEFRKINFHCKKALMPGSTKVVAFAMQLRLTK